MSYNSLVSVIMSTYNEPISYIKCSVDSILNQTLNNIQFIIIVDKPDRDSLIQLLDQYKAKDPRIVVLVNEKNEGLVYSLNKAITYSEGDFIARMDADDISLPDRLEKELAYLLDNNYDLVASNIININEDGNIISGTTTFPTNNRDICYYYKYGTCLPHPTWLARRNVFIENNGYRNFKACEDYDFIARAIINGFTVGLVEDPLLYYRINTSGISQSNKAMQKVSFLYLSNLYKKGYIKPIHQYNEFLNSVKGKRTVKYLESFYRSRKQTNNLLSLYFKFFFLSKEVRRLVINEVLIKSKLYKHI